jgi:hypothetical protein
MTESNLGPIPTPTTEEPELHPGGVDAIVPVAEPLPHDLDPEDNAALDDVVPDEIAEPDEDKEQAPDDGAVSGEDETADEPPA